MSNKPALPEAATQAISRALGTAPVLWSGMPRPRAAVLRWLAIWIIAVPWTGVALVALIPAIEPSSANAPNQFGRLGGAIAFLFVVGGVYMLLSPFFAGRTARRTVYALGPDRLWQIDLKGRSPPITHDLARVLSTERTERADGSGTLTLSMGSRDDKGHTLETEKVVLRGVPGVRRLEHLIRANMNL